MGQIWSNRLTVSSRIRRKISKRAFINTHQRYVEKKKYLSKRCFLFFLGFFIIFVCFFLYINHRHNMSNLLKIEAYYSKYHECPAEKVRNFISESSRCCWATTSMILLVMQAWVSYNISWTNKHLCHNYI